ncbi:hypothetical protein ISS07_05660 [Candidatus Woesearchaeota archaeon]|nr:hypothetical protein [Candidatus Woesearchaeota archaeon]
MMKKEQGKIRKKNILFFSILIISIFVSFYAGFFFAHHGPMDVEIKREKLITLKESIHKHNLKNHNYKCCLEKPCTYCIEKTPGHGEGSKCDCLSDVVNGVHPCGECIGEILEGHGNKYLAEYFAKAIAEKVGEEHLGTLKQIISKKYDIPIEEQA